MITLSQLQAAANDTARRLTESQAQLVLAESCTGGLVAASLTGVPGISQYLCGSFVVYQTDCKQSWLNVDARLLEKSGPVCREVAIQLVDGAMKKTPQATVAASITGHLGPNAPDGMDGLVFVGTAVRLGKRVESKAYQVVLPGFSQQTRINRQRLAAIEVLRAVEEVCCATM